MKVTVHYFGQIRQIVGRDSDTVDPEEATGLDRLLSELAGRYGGEFGSMVSDEGGGRRSSLLVAVNGEAVDRACDQVLRDGDEVTLLPPIAGG